MISYKIALSLIVLITIASSQTPTNNCPVNGKLKKLATGRINLNPNDIDTSSATKDYIVDISSGNFDALGERVGSAFGKLFIYLSYFGILSSMLTAILHVVSR